MFLQRSLCVAGLLFFLLVNSYSSQAQITGSDTTCAGYLYTFDATIAGADSFAWSMPAEWVIISGAGTSQVQALCTQNVGQVCVDGFDINGTFITQFCHTVYWGDGGVGWNVQILPATFCQCSPVTVAAIPNGTGGGCAGCGNGIISPNLSFLIYDNPLPGGGYIGIADGTYQYGLPFVSTTYYVYLMDITFGISSAILIDGGLCPSTINNTYTLDPCMYVNLPIIATPDPSCVGDTVLLSYDGSYGSFGPYDWAAWQGNVTFLPPLLGSSILCIVNASGIADVHLLGFSGMCPYAGDVFLNIQACNTGITGDTVVCSGNSYSYSINIPGAVTYTWTLPSGWYGMTGQGTASITATCNISIGNICAEGFDQIGNSLGIQCITTQWGNGLACAPPTASFISMSNPICPGTCTGFTNLSTNATSYLWSFPGANPPTDTAANPGTICYNTPGYYDVTLVAMNAAGNDTLTLPDFIIVHTYPAAQSIIQNGDTLISNTGFTSYQWYYNGNLINGATDNIYVASQIGDYNLISIDSNGCEVEAAIFNIQIGIPDELNSYDQLVVFPNPAKDYIVIDIKHRGESDVIIYNLIGEKVKMIFSESPDANNNLRINVYELMPGIYFAEVTIGGKIWRGHFVRE
ncbi:hypothetical protein BH11BAC1_BH11BAC1_04510 [soil metagenome]